MLNESTLQCALFEFREKQSHKLIVPEVGLFHGRADLLSVNSSDFVIEHEIKITKSDFLADFNKKVKHLDYRLTYETKKAGLNVPNYFYFVLPKGLINNISEIPKYSGLIEFRSIGTKIHFDIIKRAPLLHKRKINQNQKDYLARGLMFRYWKLNKKVIKQKLKK